MSGGLNVARYAMIGGFLGAGKTTAIDRFAHHLTESGLTVGLITNDQSTGLVDTAVLRSRGFAVEEIAGGCFCCRFPSLQDAAERLTAETRPDVFLAEPVGSCTDLVATVSYPLRRIYGERFHLAPLSVLVDPHRAARVLGIAPGKVFSPKVVYVYEKQLEEADIIVVNKCDTIDTDLQLRLTEELSARYPAAQVLCASAKAGTDLEPWFERVLGQEGALRPTMDIDYDIYAEGEAKLGWVNATFDVSADAPFDANGLLIRLTDSLRSGISNAGGEIAHLKMTLDAGDALGQLSVVSVVSNEGEPDLRESLLDQVGGGSLIINLRAELDPDLLSDLVTRSIQEESGKLRIICEHEEQFRPARPVPTHRDVVSATGEGSTS